MVHLYVYIPLVVLHGDQSDQISAAVLPSLPLPSMAQTNGLHIVVFPWLAFGHMMPFLELSKGLAKRGHHISFISTPRNIERLPKLPPDLSPMINFVKLTLPQVPNLPEKAEATSDLPFDKTQYLKKAFDGLQISCTSFLESSPPDMIVHDFSNHWLQPLAAKHNVPCAFFSIFTASTLAFIGSPWLRMSGEDTRTDPEHFIVPPNWIPSPSNLAFRLYEILKISESAFGENASGLSDQNHFNSATLGSNFLIIRSCEEFDGDYLHILREKLFRIPVIPVGLLPPLGEDSLEKEEDGWVSIKKWLDKQREGSVVYIAFGSEAEVSREEMQEIALGLELSGLPFFWALRRPAGSEVEISSMLPSGFQSRTKDQGFICLRWAPQRRILAHPSVGVFFSHSGWSSVIEALAVGCPLVILPISNDQPLVARFLQSKNIGVEIPRDERDGSFTRDSVAKSLRLVIVDSEGEQHKAKAREMRALFGDKARHERYMDDFDQYIRNNGF